MGSFGSDFIIYIREQDGLNSMFAAGDLRAKLFRCLSYSGVEHPEDSSDDDDDYDYDDDDDDDYLADDDDSDVEENNNEAPADTNEDSKKSDDDSKIGNRLIDSLFDFIELFAVFFIKIKVKSLKKLSF